MPQSKREARLSRGFRLGWTLFARRALRELRRRNHAVDRTTPIFDPLLVLAAIDDLALANQNRTAMCTT
jgi:hypothetical protein